MDDELKHTPGPWEYHGGDDYTVILGPGDTTDRPLAEVNSGSADARLIAAAPDLLAALKEVVRLSDRKTVAWDKAKAAIAKATT